jgi:hypothetical protein
LLNGSAPEGSVCDAHPASANNSTSGTRMPVRACLTFWLLFEKGTHNPARFDLFAVLWIADVPISVLVSIFTLGSHHYSGVVLCYGESLERLVVRPGHLNGSLCQTFFEKEKKIRSNGTSVTCHI